MKRAKTMVLGGTRIMEIIESAKYPHTDIPRLMEDGFDSWDPPEEESFGRPLSGLWRVPPSLFALLNGSLEPTMELPQVCHHIEINGGCCGQSGMGLTEIYLQNNVKLVSRTWASNNHIHVVPPRSQIVGDPIGVILHLTEATAKMFEGLVLEKIILPNMQDPERKKIIFQFSEGAQLIDYAADSYEKLGLAEAWSVADHRSCIYDN